MKLADQKFCYECAAVIRRDAEVCRVCGAAQPALPVSGGPWPLERPEADEAADWYDSLGSGSGGARSAAERPPSGRSKTVAALLAVFMPSGMFGLHRFYPGEWRAGLLYLAFFCRLTQTPTTYRVGAARSDGRDGRIPPVRSSPEERPQST